MAATLHISSCFDCPCCFDREGYYVCMHLHIRMKKQLEDLNIIDSQRLEDVHGLNKDPPPDWCPLKQHGELILTLRPKEVITPPEDDTPEILL